MTAVKSEDPTRNGLGVSALRSRPVTAIARRVTRRKLRILAYHGVPDPERFAAQMEYVVANFTPVDEQTVIAAIRGGDPLPGGAVWLTFDDGDPSVVRNGLPALARLGIAATMYVCPGLIESQEPFWWRVTDWAVGRSGELGAPDDLALTEYVKTLDDVERRSIVADLLGDIGSEPPQHWRQLSDRDLAAWTGAGMDLGNHSWDHPCLDRCSDAAQREQVGLAHEWLADRLGRPPRTFAYPNGNFSPLVDGLLDGLGYQLAVLYDNRLTSVKSSPLQLSRLMMEADQPPARLVGVLSGAQPAAAKLASRLKH